MFTTMQHHASHHFLPSEAHPLNNRAPSLSTSKSKLRKLTSMASFTKPLNVFHRRRTTNNLTSSTSTGSFQSNSDAPTQSMQRSSTFQGPLHTASEHSSYRSSDVSANSSVTSLGRARTDNDDTPRKAPRHEDHGTQETPRRPPWPRRVTSLEQQQWADSHGIDHKEEPTPTKSSRLDNCPLRKAFKEAHTPSQYRASSRITGTQRRDIPSKTPQLITPKRTPNAKSHTPFEHQRYFTDPGRTGSSKAPRRDSSTRIEQRQLLQPLPPPLPKSQTMGGFMSGSGELAIDIIRSQPSSRRGSLRASFHSISSLTDSDVSLTSSLHSRPSLGPTREYSAPVSQLRVPLVRLRPSPIPILRNCPSLGGNDEYTTPPRKRPSLSGIDEYTTPVRRGRPLSGVFEEYRSPKQIGRPSTDEDKTPRARLRKKHSADGDFKESIYAMQIRQVSSSYTVSQSQHPNSYPQYYSTRHAKQIELIFSGVMIDHGSNALSILVWTLHDPKRPLQERGIQG